jgi:hypothetical protein
MAIGALHRPAVERLPGTGQLLDHGRVGSERDHQLATALKTEAGPNFGRTEHLALVVAEQQCGHRPSFRSRRPPAADHEFLPAGALRFQPVVAAAGPIWRIGPLRHDAFEAGMAGFGKEFRAAAGEVFRLSDRAPSAPKSKPSDLHRKPALGALPRGCLNISLPLIEGDDRKPPSRQRPLRLERRSDVSL